MIRMAALAGFEKVWQRIEAPSVDKCDLWRKFKRFTLNIQIV